MTLGLVLAEPLIKSGKLKALAVLRTQRHAHLPDVSTVVELGYPDLVITAWFGLVMPRETPKSIVQRVNTEVMRALRSPEMIEKMEFVGVDAAKQHSPEDFDWTDKAITWLKDHTSASPEKPFFLYYAHNAPLHAKAEDLARYSGVYDIGWDEVRAVRAARQREMGLFESPPQVPPRSPGVPAWDEVDATRRPLLARYMELYAAVVDNIDQNIGRLLDTLAALGRLDNTLVILTSDNGANGIGGIDGAANNVSKRLANAEDPAWVREMFESGRIGAADSWPAYPLGWTDVSSTPFRLYKSTTMNGGIRVPLLMQWPARLHDAGAVRRQWVHVSDIVPTVLGLVGLEYPRSFAGYRTRGPDGTSFEGVLASATAGAVRNAQYYELAGNRGYIKDGWKIVSLQPPGTPIDLENWMLFDLRADPTEIHDLATARNDKLTELVAAFEADAAVNYVYPLDNRGLRRSLTVPPYMDSSLAQVRTFYPGTGTVPLAVVGPLVADRDYTLSCDFNYTPHDRGVVFALGDAIAGFALFARDGALSFLYHGGQGKIAECERLPAADGFNRFELRHRALGARRGVATVIMNEEVVATLDMSPTTILGLGVGEGLDIARDRRLHVTARYGASGVCAYSGSVAHVRIEPGPQASDSYANRPERLAQRD